MWIDSTLFVNGNPSSCDCCAWHGLGVGIRLAPMAFYCNQSFHTCVHMRTHLVSHLIVAEDSELLQFVATICPIMTMESHPVVLPICWGSVVWTLLWSPLRCCVGGILGARALMCRCHEWVHLNFPNIRCWKHVSLERCSTFVVSDHYHDIPISCPWSHWKFSRLV